MTYHQDYFDAGFKVFGLHGVTGNECDCGNKFCEALYKHPMISNWQNTPAWSIEQFDTMELYGQFKTGFGVLCGGYLVIDIDPRNGGNESYDLMVKDTGIDFKKEAGFVVYTGGSGWHIYYSYDGDKLDSHLKAYPGIDFKSSGFVVGAGSLHKSGASYEVEKGYPEDITPAPTALLDKLKKKARTVSPLKIHATKATPSEVLELLQFVSADEYADWVEIGMILHDELGDSGLDVWDKWSQASDKYDGDGIEAKWHSFGKSSTKVTIGTLIQKARDNGYVESVVFDTTLIATPEPTPAPTIIDLTKPTGLVGECVDYINNCSRFPRKHLAVSAALMAVSSIGGLRFVDKTYGVTPNLFTFNVAGSATGKESIQQSHSDLLIVSGMGATIYGTIKSEQEIFKSLARHQPSNYIIDEFGLLLNKVMEGSKGGSAHYLAGIIGALMSIYSKANGKLLVGADHGDALREQFSRKMAAINKLKDNHEAKDYHIAELEGLERLFMCLNSGYIDSPFLSLSGYTTPVTFNGLVSYAQATNGFIGRSIIFEEKNNNPRAKKDFRGGRIIPLYTELKLKALFNGGDSTIGAGSRVEFTGTKQAITTSPDAIELLTTIESDLHDQAGHHMEINGLEAIVRRSFELILKVSMVLAMGGDNERTVDHVNWAHALIKNDIENKIELTGANMAEEEEDLSAEVFAKVKQKLDRVDFQTVGGIRNKMRKLSKQNIQDALDYLVQHNIAIEEEHKPERGPITKRYYLK